MQVVKEESTAFILVEFANKEGAPESPDTISYQVHDLDTGTVLQVPTAVDTPAAAVEIILGPEVNVIVKEGKVKEAHRLTVIATYGLSDQQTGEFVFYIQSMGAVS